MYRVSIQPLHEELQLGEDTEVDVEDYAEVEKKDDEPRTQSHQIVKETEDMIEINLSQGDEEVGKKSSRKKEDFVSHFEPAAINSNDQLVAATSALANGASIVYILQVIIIVS